MTEITIYTRMMCGYCAAAKRLLDSKGVAYTEHDASFSPEMRQEMIRRANGRSTFPQIFIGETHVGGSDELHELERGGRLDAMLEGVARGRGIMSTTRVAALQMRSTMDVGRNVETFEALVREAATKGAVYVQSPEMTGALMRDRASLKAAITSGDKDQVAAKAAALAAELSIHIHVGSTAIARDDGKVANRAFLFGPDGTLITIYDKIHMFDVDLDNGESWRESNTYEPGKETVVADLGYARLGMSVCYDLRFPQLFRAQAMAGAEILTTPAAFTRQTGEAHWHILLRARAIENGAFVIAAAQGGKHEDGRETYGHSLVIDPWGEVIAEADHDEPGVVIADIDVAKVAAARSKIPNLDNARPFEVTTIPASTGRERQAS